MLTRDDVQSAAKLSGPTVGTRSKTTEVAPTNQDMDEWLKVALVGRTVRGLEIAVVATRRAAAVHAYSLREARANHVGEQTATRSREGFRSVGNVAFDGGPLAKVISDGRRKPKKILAGSRGRRFHVIESEGGREVPLGIRLLGKRGTPAKKHQA